MTLSNKLLYNVMTPVVLFTILYIFSTYFNISLVEFCPNCFLSCKSTHEKVCYNCLLYILSLRQMWIPRDMDDITGKVSKKSHY